MTGVSKSPLWIVTGASGFLGNTLVRTLLERGHRVRACIMEQEIPESLQGLDCEIVPMDLRDPDSIHAAFVHDPAIPATVVHSAGVVSIEGKVSTAVRKVNVVGTQHVLVACREAAVDRLVYVSSVHAIRESDAPEGMVELDQIEDFDPEFVSGEYAKTKTEATAAVLAADDLWRVIVHPSGMIGPNDYDDSYLGRLVRDVAGGKLAFMVAGGYDFVDVRDVAEGVIAAAEQGTRGRTYILSGHYLRIAEVVDIVSRLAGRARSPRIAPLWLAKAVAPFAELHDKIRGTKPLFTRYSLRTLGAPSNFSHARATEELGYRPRAMAATIEDTLDWLAEHRDHIKPPR